jgi:hypothetical protein
MAGFGEPVVAPRRPRFRLSPGRGDELVLAEPGEGGIDRAFAGDQPGALGRSRMSSKPYRSPLRRRASTQYSTVPRRNWERPLRASPSSMHRMAPCRQECRQRHRPPATQETTAVTRFWVKRRETKRATVS